MTNSKKDTVSMTVGMQTDNTFRSVADQRDPAVVWFYLLMSSSIQALNLTRSPDSVTLFTEYGSLQTLILRSAAV